MRNVLMISALEMMLGLAGCYENSGKLENTAREFVQKLGNEPIGASCMNRDSDHDGYVSCTVSIKGSTVPLSVECASQWALLTQGCKLQRGQQAR